MIYLSPYRRELGRNSHTNSLALNSKELGIFLSQLLVCVLILPEDEPNIEHPTKTPISAATRRSQNRLSYGTTCKTGHTEAITHFNGFFFMFQLLRGMKDYRD